ncbi:MAG: hypothetical protein RR047_02575 [Bacilli bacterium]
MGLMDKLKNVFFEEEYVEVEEQEKVKKVGKKKDNNVIARKIELPKRVDKEEVKEEEIIKSYEEDKEVLADKELLKMDNNFKQFDDDDFEIEDKKDKEVIIVPKDSSSVNTHVPYGGDYKIDYTNLYSKTEKTEREFRPTPIISPIYGILDKNYSKDDIVDKKDRVPSSSYAKKIDLDSVRQKAYGEVSYNEEVKDNQEEEIEDNLLYDMSDIETTPAVEKVTIADAEEYFEDLGLQYNIDYKDKTHERASGRRVRYVKEEDKEEEKEEVIVKKDNPSLEDNLFDLIDSMYEDKE